jgi:uridine kinase
MHLVITGHSSSGKSSLAKVLAARRHWPRIAVDDFWRKEHPPVYTSVDGERIRIYDAPSLYDGAAAAAAALAHPNALIEGFSAMYYPEVIAACGLHVHLATPWTVCAQRRASRRRRPSDLSWLKLGEAWHETIQKVQAAIPSTLLLEDEPLDRQLARVLARLDDIEAAATP